MPDDMGSSATPKAKGSRATLTPEQRAERLAERRATARRREAMAEEERAQRAEERRKQWVRDGTYLSYEELKAGVPCRACGEVWVGDAYPPGDIREQAGADWVAFKAKHPDCYTARIRMEGGRHYHCGECCPPPPLAPAQIEKLRPILAHRPSPGSLWTWTAELTCGHVADIVANRDHYPHNEHSLRHPRRCAECGDVLRGVINVVLKSEGVEPPPAKKARRTPAAPSPQRRAALERRLRTAEAEVAKLGEQLGTATPE